MAMITKPPILDTSWSALSLGDAALVSGKINTTYVVED